MKINQTNKAYLSCTMRLYPALRRLFAIWNPIFPSPMNPTLWNKIRIGNKNKFKSLLLEKKNYQKQKVMDCKIYKTLKIFNQK
jgi:hypothetical protein